MQIFHHSTNTLSKVSIFGALFLVGGGAVADPRGQPLALRDAGGRGARASRCPSATSTTSAGSGIDCRYCHTSVEVVGHRRHPADQDLHELPLADLEPEPDARAGARELPHRHARSSGCRVHDLPDFAYFNHSAHVNKGVGCTTCHGPRRPHAAHVARSSRCRWSGASTATATPRSTSGRRTEVFNVAWRAARRPARAGPRRWCRSTASRPAPAAPRATDEPRARPAVPVDLSGVRRRLDGAQRPRATGRASRSWRQTPEFLEFLHREFPEQASEFERPRGPPRVPEAHGRVAGAGRPHRLHAPAGGEDRPLREAARGAGPRPAALLRHRAASTAATRTGVLVESHMGRPTKIEGNPEHPASLGATDARGQAASSTSTTPTARRRSRYLGEIRVLGRRSSRRCARRSTRSAALGGAGLRILTETVTSPTLAAQMRRDPRRSSRRRSGTSGSRRRRDSARAGAVLAFGQPVDTRYRLRRRPTSSLSLDADFVERRARQPPLHPRVRAATRKLDGGSTTMNRLYVVESTPALTGSLADHRLRRAAVRGRGLRARARGRRSGVAARAAAPARTARWVGRRWPRTCRRSAGARARGRRASTQPPAVHALAHAINAALGQRRHDRRLHRARRGAARRPDRRRCATLAADMERGRGRRCWSCSAATRSTPRPPTSTSPRPLDKVAAARPPRASTTTRPAERCHWHVPQAHALESLGRRARLRRHRHHPAAADRAALRRQVGPRGAGRVLARGPSAAATTSCASTGSAGGCWRGRLRARGGAARCTTASSPGTAPPRGDGRRLGAGAWPRPRQRPRRRASSSSSAPTPPSATAASPTTAGCRSCRKPLTKLTWDNAALMSPATAAAASASPIERTARGTHDRRGRAALPRPHACRRRSGSCPASPTTP